MSREIATVVEDDVDHFRSYLLATFHGREFQEYLRNAIAASKPHPTNGDEAAEVSQAREQAFETLIGVWILADKYRDVYRANRVMDQLVCFSHGTKLLPHLGAINLAYDSTLEDSPLRSLLRDLFVHEAGPSALEAIVRNADLHPDFAVDIAFEFCKLKCAHLSGTIQKWLKQDVIYRPKGHYHQGRREQSPKKRGVLLWGTFEELLQIIDTTRT